MRKRPDISIDNISVRDAVLFASEVYERKFEEATIRLGNILQSATQQAFAPGDLKEVSSTKLSSRIRAILVGAIDALISDPQFSLNEGGIRMMICLKSALKEIYASSSHIDTTHFQVLLSDIDGSEARVRPENFIKLLLVASIDTLDEQLLKMIEGMKEDIQFLLWLSFLDNKTVFDERAKNKVDRLISGIDQIRPTAFKNQIEVFMAARVWFVSTFWDNSNKHKVKRLINGAFELTAEEQRFYPVNAGNFLKKKKQDKLVLILVLEAWTVSHSMYRSYARLFRSLSKYYTVIAVGEKSRVNKKATEMFDELILHGPRASFQDTKKLIKKIADKNPDVMLFSSLGMDATAIQLANLRLAPVQMMLAGHPDSSFSEKMGYLLVEDGFLPSKEYVSEELVVMRRGSTISFLKPDKKLANIIFSKPRDRIKIVCNSLYQKITPEFIKVCVEIQQRSLKPLEFHFVIGADLFTQEALMKLLKQKMKDVNVYHILPYTEYSEIISQCHLQLTPFPFGNTNSFVDAMMLGIPTICLVGDELCSAIDPAMSRKMGLPEICRAKTLEEYVTSALKLIEDDSAREVISEQLLNTDLDEVLFFDISQGSDDFAELIRETYNAHQTWDRHLADGLEQT